VAQQLEALLEEVLLPEKDGPALAWLLPVSIQPDQHQTPDEGREYLLGLLALVVQQQLAFLGELQAALLSLLVGRTEVELQAMSQTHSSPALVGPY
jgi:hypothetical protein